MQQLSASEIHNFQKILNAEKIRLQDRIQELSLQDPFSDPERLTTAMPCMNCEQKKHE